MYRALRPLLFAADAEFVHHATLAALERVGRNRAATATLSAVCTISDPRLVITRFGIEFPNPIGLAAGMDKDGRALPAWQALGFGFTEVGSVTALPQPGNPKPRLFRLPDHGAIVNRMGFNNEGAHTLARRLEASEASGSVRIPVFVNVGKSRATPLEEAAEDYRQSLTALWSHAAGAVINVSSPNTPGLRSLQEPVALKRILEVVDGLQLERPVPVLLKLAPDLSDDQLRAIVETAESHRIDGLVAVNTTLTRPGVDPSSAPEGGLSGRPLASRSLAVLRLLTSLTSLPLVSVGGIFTAADVIERLRAGASLVEIYTGFIYGGPGTVRSMLRGIVRHLEHEGLPDVAALIGADR